MPSTPSPQGLSWRIQHTIAVAVVLCGVIITTLIIFFSDLRFAFGQPNINQTQTWATNGTVYDVVVGGDGTVYVGGDFTFVGPQTGYGVVINTTTQTRDTNYPVFYKSGGNGKIWDIVPDGSGGWYVAGDFDRINGSASDNLVRLNSDGSVNGTFDASPNGGVYDLYLYNGVLYAGGTFSQIGGSSRTALAALDPDTGAALSWDPKLDSTTVYAMDSDATNLYVGGSFQSVSSTTRNGGAAVSLATGELTDWNPNFGFGTVYSLNVTTTGVYVGGNFTDVGGDNTHSSLTEVDKVNGTPTGWDPSPGGAVYDIEIDGDGTLFVVGAFSNMGSDTRNYIAALDPTTGSSTAWNPGANQAVNEVILDGNTVYVAGGMTEVGGQTRYYLAAIDKTTGTVDGGFDFSLSNSVEGLALSGSTLFIGGDFTLADGVVRNNIAAVNPSNGEVTTWNPNANDDVYSLLISGDNIYVGGKFSTIGGASRSKLAAIDLTSGLATSWDPNVSGGFARGVDDMVLDGDTLYIGGDFTNIGSDSRSYLGAVSITTGSSTAWNPGLSGGFNGIYALANTTNTIFAGGDFTSVGGDSRSFVAEISKATGSSTAWDASASAGFSGSVGALTISGDTLYIGGRFSSIGGQSRDNLAALDMTTALATAWTPTGTYSGFGMGPLVGAVEVANGFVYVGGGFTELGAQSRTGVAAIDATTGLANSWNPSLTSGFGNAINSIALDGSAVYLGGGFTTVGTQLNSNFAQFGPVNIQFTSSTYAQSETVTGVTTTIQISTSNTSTEDITFTLAITGGTAAYGSDYTMTTGTFTIAAGQSSTSTAITITNDATSEADETIILTLSSPSFADIGTNSTYTYTIQNDDIVVAGVTITESGGTTAVQETATSTDTYTIVLDSEPTDSVTIAVTADTQATVSTSSIVFTAGNWNVPVTVTTSPVTDDIDEASPHTSTITHTATSNDLNYDGIGINNVSVSITDNDTAGVTVSAISGNTTEGAVTSTFTVVLNSEPTSTVTMSIASSDTTEGTVSTSSLNFTSANWDTPQTVTVTGVNDDIDDGDVGYMVTVGAVVSDDGSYSGINPNDVNVTNTDNDTAGVTVTQSGGTTAVTEVGATDTYTVVLDSEPASNVTVAVSSDADSTVSTSSIVFTSANWDTPVTVTVTAVDDDIDEASPHTSTISHTVSSDDVSYDGSVVGDISASVTDDDTAGVTVTASGGSTAVIEGGTTDTYTIVLDSEPTATVTIAVAVDAQTTVSTSSISFTTLNWSTPVTVTVTAVDDQVTENADQSSTITHTATSDDTAYNGVAVASITATITDNDSSGGRVVQPPTPVISEPAPPTPAATQVVTLPAGEEVPVTVGGASHTMTATSATEEEVTVRVESEPIYVTVKKGQFEDVDSDKNGTADMRIAYNGLKDGEPELVVTELIQELKEILINGNSPKTTSREVRVRVNVENATSIALSNTSNFENTGFAPVQSEVDWTLSEGFGTKTVYARLRLTDGGIVTVNDSIEYVETVTCPLTAGKAYKTAQSPAVYYITESCTKRPFQNSRVYFTYFTSFAEVQTVSATLLNRVEDDYLGFMPLGPKAVLLQGSIVKSVTHPAVYLLVRSERRHIVNETVFNALRFGWNWVEDVAGEVLNKFKVGQEIDQAIRPAYTLIKYESSPDVYILEPASDNSGKLLKRKIQKYEDIGKLGYRADTIVTVLDAEQYEDGPVVVVQ